MQHNPNKSHEYDNEHSPWYSKRSLIPGTCATNHLDMLQLRSTRLCLFFPRVTQLVSSYLLRVCLLLDYVSLFLFGVLVCLALRRHTLFMMSVGI